MSDRFFGKEFEDGTPISRKGFARGIRGMSKALDKLSVHNGKVSWSADNIPKIIMNASTASGALVAFECVTESGDYLMCARVVLLDASQQPVPAAIPEGATETLVKVWKPWLLRRTPFDGKTRDGITYETKPDGYDYEAGEENIRLADDGTTTEWQTITPSYSLRTGSGETLVAGELIYAVPMVPTATAGEYSDVNQAGRCWATTTAPTVTPPEEP
jgi:hypothetical protein